MKIISFQGLVALFLVSLLACGGAKPVMISQSDIQKADSTKQLVELYEQVEAQKADAGRKQRKHLAELQLEIADRLASKIKTLVDTQIAANQSSNGLIDLHSLNLSLKEVEMLRSINPTQYQLLKNQLAERVTATTNELLNLKSDLSQINPLTLEGVKQLEKIAALAGKGSDEFKEYQETRLALLESFGEQAREAYAKRMFNTSLELAEKGLQIDPGNLELDSMRTQSQTELFEQAFRSAMEHGKPDQAYQALLDVSDKPIMRLIKRRMASSISLLAKYFANNAQLHTQKEQLYQAYHEFLKARQIQKILDKGDLGFPQERQFLDKVMLLINKNEENLGKTYALLKLVEKFDSNYPTLSQQLSESKSAIAQRASSKIMISDFKEIRSSNSVIASVGRRVSKQLENILFNQLGQQVQLVGDISTSSKDDQLNGLAYLIRGDVLQSAIETTKHLGQRNKLVKVATEKMETDAYKKWSKRKRGEAPPRYIEKEIKEEVSLKVEHIKKLAILEISYQILDPYSHKVLVSKNLSKEAVFQGETVLEFQKGLFKQNLKEADLPSDIKIMDQLAKIVSAELGESLILFLANPDQAFYARYQETLEKGDKLLASNLLANAIIVSDNEEVGSEWTEQLINHSLSD